MTTERKSRILITWIGIITLLAMGTAGTVPYVDNIVVAGDTFSKMDVMQLMGTVMAGSLALSGFLAYLLYRSQKEIWEKVIVTLTEIKDALNNDEKYGE
jgi:hypothetical protein